MTKTKIFFLILIIIAYFLSVIPSYSQERQVPLDLNNQIMIIDKDLRTKLNLFSDIENFSDARLFMDPDSNFVLELSYYTDNALSRERRKLSYGEVNL